MDLVYILKTLWRNRGWLVLAAVVAALVGLAAGYELRAWPPKVDTRAVQYGTGTTKVLVDTNPSTLTDTAVEYEPLIKRAAVYAQLFSSSSLRRLVAQYSGIPPADIVTDVPSNARLITNQPRGDTASSGTERSTEIVNEDASYRLDIDVEADLPVISIATQAPNETEALRLANGAAEGLREFVRQLRPREPEGRIVRIRRLGNAAGDTVSSRTGPMVALLAGIGAFAIFCVIIVTAASVARRWRESDGAAVSLGSDGDPFDRDREPASAAPREGRLE